MSDFHQHGGGGGYDLLSLLFSKVLPALAGGLVRNIFPPRKVFWQRAAEMLGGVILVIYTGHHAGAVLWALLGWGLSKIGVNDPSLVMDRVQTDQLAAFLVGLVGMTVVEGGLVFLRQWSRNPLPK